MRIVPRLVILAVVLALSVVAVSPASAASLPALPPPSGTILGVHTVQSAETLDRIGRAYAVDPNPIAQTTYVTTTILGQHTVLQGEWIYCIGRAYRVDPMAIAQASGIPGPYGPVGWYGGYHPYPYGGAYPPPYGGGYPYYYGGYYPYYSPWNYVLPGQVLKIPAVPWYNMPAGPTCAPQSTVTLPPGW